LKTKKLLIFILVILGAILLNACSRGPITTNWPGLAADADRAYLSNGSTVYAVDMKTGQEAWRYPDKADAKLLFYADPVLTPDGQLLIGSSGATHALISLDPATGTEKWAAPFTGAKGTWLASPLVLNEKIYAPNTDEFLYILDLNGKQAAAPVDIGGALWSTPVTDGSLIYITSIDHHYHVYDPATGKLGAPVDLGGAVPSSPAIGTDGNYVGSFASTIEFIQPNGNHKVIAKTKNWIWGTPAINGGILYYADLDGMIYSLDLASGKQNWDALKPDGPIVAGLLAADDQIYVGTEAGTFVALDPQGKTVWQKTTGGKIYTTPVISGDLILVAPYQADYLLAAFDKDGKQAWTFTPQK